MLFSLYLKLEHDTLLHINPYYWCKKFQENLIFNIPHRLFIRGSDNTQLFSVVMLKT
jgi:hypothetical protein